MRFGLIGDDRAHAVAHERAPLAVRISPIVIRAPPLVFDTSKPDGAPRELLDVSRLNALGWRAKIPLKEGLAEMYRDFLTSGGRNVN